MVETRSGSSSVRKPTRKPSADSDDDVTREVAPGSSALAPAPSAVSAAAASRENFLRRLEMEQRPAAAKAAEAARPCNQGGGGTDHPSPETPQGESHNDGDSAGAASDTGAEPSAGEDGDPKDVPRGNSNAENATGVAKASQDPNPSAKDTPREKTGREIENGIGSEGATDRKADVPASEPLQVALLRETPLPTEHLKEPSVPKEKQLRRLRHESQQENLPTTMTNNASNQDILAYLVDQCGLKETTDSQPPIDLDRDVDPSSLAFLKGLASATMSLNSNVATAASSTLSAPCFSTDNVSTLDVRDSRTTTTASDTNIPGGITTAGNNGSNSHGTSNDNGSPTERHIIHLLGQQLTLMQEMQARIDAMGSIMARMEQEINLLRNGGEGGGYYHNSNIGDPTHARATVTRRYGRMGGLLDRDGRLPHEQLWPSPNGTVWRRGQRDGIAAVREVNAAAASRQQQPPREGDDTVNGPLPEGWMEVYDPYSRRTHYYHEATNTSSSVPPGAALHPQQQQSQPNAETPPAEVVRDGAVAAEVYPNNDGAIAPPFHRGIFFPLFVSLFRFLLSLPQHVRGLLLDSGPGRVYAHLRDRAIERRAFANVDVSALIKLLVMMLIITGRMGGGGGGSGGRGVRDRRRVLQEQQQQRRDDDDNDNDEEDGLASLLYSFLQMMVDFWNGHRTHTLFMAAVIAFLIQVGLMSFFYQVIWVERDELFRVWMGWEHEHDELERDGVGSLDADVGNQNNDGGHPAEDADLNGAEPAEANNDAAAGERAPPRPAGAVPPAAPARGMIRRGPHNGGIIHDVQCLILSFLLSLIPAWKPEEAAQPPRPPDVNDQRQQ
ncbi:hypothetical protein ACHAXS_010395 [Conticribra weissflogii]